MVMGEVPEEVDIAVIGGGVGGYTAAIRAAELGKSVALIEKEKLGGHCLNYACIPSKTLIHISNIAYDAMHSQKFGINAENVTVDARKMLEWRMGVSEKLERGVAFLCKQNKIDVLKGAATFIEKNRIQVTDGTEVIFKNAIIATGSVPSALKGMEFNGRNIIDYKQALMMDRIPKSMAIIGAGYVSVEIGTLYAKLGSNVSIIARSDVLSKFDREAVSIIKSRMQGIGIKIYANAEVKAYSGEKLMLGSGDTVDAEIVVVAVGLSPYTDGMSLDTAGVELDNKGFIRVNEKLQTSNPDIYAIGDVIGEPMLAHKSMRQGVVAAEAAAGLGSTYNNLVIPAVIFSDPEIAIAGSVEETNGIKVKKFPLSALGRAIALDSTSGFAKIAYDSENVVTGIEVVSPDANAMIAEAALAIEMGATLEDIADTIHPHPTYSESIKEVAEAALGRPIHFFYG
ncbi:MAG: dihydrolipoyl dehydrogenase [Candidatus Marsarchaeota archaeon]|nr:dihydrolipoyl dehydrogenase [Candidatus Marsarchaeota archaeon]MCL5102371.1 dihydrolipoyl dehydrogenase [Candidatus Marsarchaeota archaeon]